MGGTRALHRAWYLIPVLGILLNGDSAFAQGEYNVWHFGQNAGLDFNGGAPVSISGGMVSTIEGCASICDPSGSLLFYTDGVTVFNQQHQVMPNGTGLAGGNSSSQSAIILRQPGSSTLFFIFTAAENPGTAGLNYSVVDMTLSGGLGEVITLNTPLTAPTCEKVTVARHANGIDRWILTKESGSPAYHAFLLTSDGVEPGVVTSNVGVTVSDGAVIGYMRADQAGARVAVANRTLNILEVLDLNNATGTLSNPMTFTDFNSPGIYGVEFSGDGRFLYVSESATPSSSVYQYDLLAGTQAQIAASRVLISTAAGWGGCLQMGPDGKIYHAQYQADYLGVINAPEMPGLACDYAQQGVALTSGSSNTGLPNVFVQNEPLDPFIIATDGCAGDSVAFSIVPDGLADGYAWNFGDPASGAANSSTLSDPLHLFSGPGAYVVTAIIDVENEQDTITTTVDISMPPQVELGNDTSLCEGAILVLDATAPDASYLWQDGSTAPGFTVSTPGSYSVEVTSGSCSAVDSIEVAYVTASAIDLGPDVTICEGTSLLLDASTPGATYLWQDGSTNATFTVTSAGTYSVVVTLGGCSASSDIEVQLSPLPELDLGPDMEACTGDTIVLSIQGTSGVPVWQDGSTADTLAVTTTGDYWVDLDLNGCVATDTVRVVFDDCANPVIILPNVFSPNADGQNDHFIPLLISGDPVKTITIWNRWGQQVYSADGPPHWDGRAQNRSTVPDGTYYWTMEPRPGAAILSPLSGTVTLVR